MEGNRFNSRDTMYILKACNTRTFFASMDIGTHNGFKVLTNYGKAVASGYMKFQFDAKQKSRTLRS
jgi:hypothetical protein